MDCVELLDWLVKLWLFDGFWQWENLSWLVFWLYFVDLQYFDVWLDKGLYNWLVVCGLMKCLVIEYQVLSVVENLLIDICVYFCGECLCWFGVDIVVVSWDLVIFDLGGDLLVCILMLELLWGSKVYVGVLLDLVDSVVELVE